MDLLPFDSVGSINTFCRDPSVNWQQKDQIAEFHDVFKTSTPDFPEGDALQEEQLLPRIFHPHGSDWDLKLTEVNYGADVVLINQSVSSTSTRSFSSSPSQERIPNNLANYEDLLADVNTPICTKTSDVVEKNNEVDGLNGLDSVSKQESRGGSETTKKVLKKRHVIRHYGPKTEAGTAVMEAFWETDGAGRDSATIYNGERLQKNALSSHRTGSQHETLKSVNDSCEVEERMATDIVRRPTVERMGFSVDMHSSRPSRQKSMISDDERRDSYFSQIKRLTRELGSIDLGRHTALQPEMMNNFCHSLLSGNRALVLQGRQVFEKTGRRIQDVDLPYIFEYLIHNPDVVYLDLSYNNVTGTGAHRIMDFLAWTTTVKGLNLMNNDIETLNLQMIQALCENTSLKSLRINGNALGQKNAEYLAYLLMFRGFEHLDLGQTCQTVTSLAWVSQALIKKNSLKVLDLSRVLGQSAGHSESLSLALIFSDILRFSSSLVELHLKSNNLSDVDVEELMFGLSFNNTLEMLDLGCNRIGDRGAESIAEHLTKGAPLRALILEANLIGDIGARALSYKLASTRIQILDVSFNQIRDQGIIDLVQSSNKWPHPIVALFIFGNRLQNRSLEVINDKLAKQQLNPATLDISIWYCDGVIGHGRNVSANRYRSRYYRVPGMKKLPESRFDDNVGKATRRHTSLNYQFHNEFSVNWRKLSERFNGLSSESGPTCAV